MTARRILAFLAVLLAAGGTFRSAPAITSVRALRDIEQEWRRRYPDRPWPVPPVVDGVAPENPPEFYFCRERLRLLREARDLEGSGAAARERIAGLEARAAELQESLRLVSELRRALAAAEGPPSRGGIGDYAAWWAANRDALLMPPAAGGGDGKIPALKDEDLRELITLTGHRGDFEALVREAACRRLRAAGTGERLSALLTEAEPDRAWAARALGALSYPRAAEGLAEALRSPDGGLRGAAAFALGLLGSSASAPAALLAASRDRSEGADVRCLAILALAGSPPGEVRGALAAIALDAGDPCVPARRAACLALGAGAGEADLQALLALAEDRDPRLRGAALLGLGLGGGGGDALIRHLDAGRETDPAARAAAAAAMGLAASPAAAAPLVRCLERDGDPAVRGSAALALGRMRVPEALPALCRALARDDSPSVSAFAAAALGLSGSPQALQPLLDGLGGRSPELSASCAIGLAFLGDAAASPDLRRTAKANPFPEARGFALAALGRLRPADALPALLEGLKDPAPSVRHAAAMALGALGDPRACPALEGLLEDPDETAREGAALALALLDPAGGRGCRWRQLRDRLRGERDPGACRADIQALLGRHLPAGYRMSGP